MQTEIIVSVRLFNKGCYDDRIVNHFLFQVLNKYNKELQIQIEIFVIHIIRDYIQIKWISLYLSYQNGLYFISVK